MKPIAATVGAEGRRDFFWLDAGFSMMASSPGRGIGFNLRFGGIFTSVPAAVTAMARRDLDVSPGGVFAPGGVERESAAVIGTLSPPSIAHAPAGGAVLSPVGVLGLTQRIDLFGLGRDYAMFHKR